MDLGTNGMIPGRKGEVSPWDLERVSCHFHRGDEEVMRGGFTEEVALEPGLDPVGMAVG